MTNGASNEPRQSIRYPNIRRNYSVAGIVAYYIVERYNTYPKIESRRADSSTAAEIGQAESLPMMNLLFALIVWFGQTAVPPVFEVASIKEARPPSSIENIQVGQFHVGMNINGSRADYGFMSLADLIPYAYRVKRYQLSGPSWMNETRWDILAKIPEGEPVDRAPELMQNLLVETFKLWLHGGNGEQSVYALVVGKGGLKIKEAAPKKEPGVGRFLNLQSTFSNDQRVNGLLTVRPMYRQFEPLHQKVLHHLGSAIHRLTFRNLGQNIPSGFVHPTRSRQLIPFDAVSVWDQVGKRHESVVGTGSVDVHPNMKPPCLDVLNR